MTPRYVRQHRAPRDQPYVKAGELVVATALSDGYPGHPFCIGFYKGTRDHCGEKRHLVVDARGREFRKEGFQRVAPVGKQRGEWMLSHLSFIKEMKDRFSVWHWYHAPWRELRALDDSDAPAPESAGRSTSAD